MASPWEWDASARRYRDTRSGKYLSVGRVKELRDTYIAHQSERAASLARKVASGDMTVQAWLKEKRALVKTVHAAEYALGRGGRNAMTKRDWGRVGAAVKKQYKYLQGFAEDMADGKLSAGQIEARSKLYVASATVAHERGNAAAHGEPDLPAYPGDGSTECFANCRCAWHIEQDDEEYRATWKAKDDGATCDDCERRGQDWNPLTIPK